MGRKPGSVLGLKFLSPGYYLRRPRRLGFIVLLFAGAFFFFSDRQNQARELEAMTSRIEQLEGEKGSLMAELNSLKRGGAKAGEGGRDASSGVKADPLIMGVGVGGGARKLLPEKKAAATGEGSTAGVVQGQGGVNGAAAATTAGEQHQQQQVQQEEPQQQQQQRAEEGVLKTAVSGDAGARETGVAQDATEELRVAEMRRESVRRGMEYAWAGYEKYAWGEDELQPLSRNGVSNFGKMGATIVDSLDTLFIMGLTEQFNKARNWVAANLDFDKDYTCSVFETTIRVLGGLLSAYDLSGDSVFLGKARDIADRLLPAWNTPSGVPWNYINLRDGSGHSPGWTGGSTILADAGTTQMEMVALTQRTNDSKYAEASEKVISVIERHFPENGLAPIYINPQSGDFVGSQISFGAMGDSFYEYLLKVWVLGGKSPGLKRYRAMWEKSMRGMTDILVKRTKGGLTYVAEQNGGGIIDKMDHLLCFVSGMLVMGAEDADEKQKAQFLDLAKELTRTCYEFYASQPSKLSGENYRFDTGMAVGDVYNIGRPETVEALFYMWRATKDPVYREWGWNIWQAFEKQCKIESGGYTGLRNVAQDPPPKDNMMQSFFLAETLKYLYLLFSPDDVIPLDRWVFNTEAHPIKIVPRDHPFGR